MIKKFVDKRKSREPWSTPYARKKYRKVINGKGKSYRKDAKGFDSAQDQYFSFVPFSRRIVAIDIAIFFR